jgi:hypothetical protein
MERMHAFAPRATSLGACKRLLEVNSLHRRGRRRWGEGRGRGRGRGCRLRGPRAGTCTLGRRTVAQLCAPWPRRANVASGQTHFFRCGRLLLLLFGWDVVGSCFPVVVFTREPDGLEFVCDGGGGDRWIRLVHLIGQPRVRFSVWRGSSRSRSRECACQQSRSAARRIRQRAPQLQDPGPHRTSPQTDFPPHSLHQSFPGAVRVAPTPPPPMEEVSQGKASTRVCVCRAGRLPLL